MLVVFDLDGTLVDSADDLAASASELATTLGGRPLSVPEVVGMVGEGAALLVQRALGAAGLDPHAPGALERFLDIYDRRLLERTRPYDGIPEALALLAARGPLAVLTNKPAGAMRKLLAGLGLDRYFAESMGQDGTFARKPDPGGLLALRVHARGGPMLLVGDSPIDARTAQAAGVPFVYAKYGFGGSLFPPGEPITPYVAEHARDLPDLVDRVERLIHPR
jgi:phosphoglycolate phosphatase